MSHRGFAAFAIDRRTDAQFAAQADACGKIAVPLSYTGNGTGVLTLNIYSTTAQVAYMDKLGSFYSDSGGTTGKSPVTALAVGWNALYIKVPSGTCNLVFSNRTALTNWGDASHQLIVEATNGPKVNGFNVAYIGSAATVLRSSATNTASVLTGSVAGLTSLTYLYLSGSSLTCSGSVAGLTSLTYLVLGGSSLTCSGSVAGLTSLTYLYLSGSSLTCSGSVAGLTSLTYLVLGGNSLTCSGSVAGLTSLTYLVLNGNSLTCTYNTTSGGTTQAITSRLYVTLPSFTSAMVDSILIDADNHTTAALTTQPIYLVTGNAPTSTSAAARASLVAKGNTVTTS